jgi:hypothetical protein
MKPTHLSYIKEEESEQKPWLKIKVPTKVKVALHEHELHAMPNIDDDEWACNGINMFTKGCYGGITDFYQTKGIQGWRCPIDECDFDICVTCIQHSLYEERKMLEAKK